ncbi:hypothetical protein FB451DRAFT_1272839 [Mycena latifolia]|nr:hypothetical protein FB451DRAFT_1272839 [Mycena latifolia]
MPQIPAAPPEASTIIWANRALIAGAVVYIYDSLLTFSLEVHLYGRRIRRKLLVVFIPVRYASLLYQIVVVVGVAWYQFTARSCRVLDNVVLSLDTVFQVPYVAFISWRLRNSLAKGWIPILPLALFGFAAPLISIIAPNPSLFPECRVLNPIPTSRCADIVALLPCLRAVFDALGTITLLVRITRAKRSIRDTLGLKYRMRYSKVQREEIDDLMMIFSIMAMEAVFVQIPSAREHARNYIAPFVDSMTAALTARLFLKVAEEEEPDEDDWETSSTVSQLEVPPRASSPPNGAFHDGASCRSLEPRGDEPNAGGCELQESQPEPRSVSIEEPDRTVPPPFAVFDDAISLRSLESCAGDPHGNSDDLTRRPLEPMTYGIWLPSVPVRPVTASEALAAGPPGRRKRATVRGSHTH